VPARPEGDAKPDEKDSGQEQKECGRFEPSDRRHKKCHGKAKKAVLHGDEIDTARKVPSASNIKSTRPFAGAATILLTGSTT
jgi:hypothetical protein